MINFLLPLLAWAIWFNLFLYREIGAVGWVVGFLGQCVIIWWGLRRKDRTIGKWWWVILAVLGFQMVRTANPFVTGLLGLSMVVVQAYGVYLLASCRKNIESITEGILIPFKLLGNYLASGFNAIATFSLAPVAKVLGGRLGKTATTILGGLIVGIPVCGVLIFLFTQADPIFKATLMKWFESWPELRVSERVIPTVVMTLLVVPVMLMKIKDNPGGSVSKIVGWMTTQQAVVSGVLVAIVLGSFLVIQSPYVFMRAIAPTALQQFGITTYSEYVRKGFGELLFVAVILYGAMGVGYMVYQRTGAKDKMLLVIQGVLGLEFLIFVVSVLRRVWLYQVFHGWSLVRIYGSVFLIWVIGMVVFLVLRHLKKRVWVQMEMIFTIGIILILGAFNAEKFLMTNPPTVNGRVDYAYLSNLSADGFEGWKMAMDNANKILFDTKYSDPKTVIDKESRREILYAGVITGNLSDKYDQLIKTYGNRSEVENYWLAALDAADMQALIIMPVMWVDGSNPAVNKKSPIYASLKNKVKEGKEVNFYSNKNFFGSYYKPSVDSFFYTGELGDVNRTRISNGVDKLLLVNFSDKQAFEKMQMIGVQKQLFEMQNQFTKLYVRVLSQPEKEQEVEIDTNLNSRVF